MVPARLDPASLYAPAAPAYMGHLSRLIGGSRLRRRSAGAPCLPAEGAWAGSYGRNILRELVAGVAEDADAFVEEVRKRRPKPLGKLTPAALRALREGHASEAPAVLAGRAEATLLERRLSGLVNAAYGLTPEEEALLRSTAPPRTPRF